MKILITIFLVVAPLLSHAGEFIFEMKDSSGIFSTLTINTVSGEIYLHDKTALKKRSAKLDKPDETIKYLKHLLMDLTDKRPVGTGIDDGVRYTATLIDGNKSIKRDFATGIPCLHSGINDKDSQIVNAEWSIDVAKRFKEDAYVLLLADFMVDLRRKYFSAILIEKDGTKTK